MITVYPIWILPLFNTLAPMEPGKLKTDVEALAARLKFPLKHLYVIDGSKRSAHSNAYFFGLPWSKHIVIYDTLIEKSEVSEVVAVLGHELGHWKEGHTTKMFGISQVRESLSGPTLKPLLIFSFSVPSLLHFCAILSIHQQYISLRSFRLLRDPANSYRVPLVQRYPSTS